MRGRKEALDDELVKCARKVYKEPRAEAREQERMEDEREETREIL